MGILRDTMYTDRIQAVLREYGANAWDAHRDAGKPELPVKVTLPTETEPTLSIRDYGTGMSSEDVFTVYTQYGASTKRGSDIAVGMLGIGSKSGFAYADSFTVTSWHGGVKHIYVAALDVTNKGVINLLHKEPCGEETGVEVKLAVKREDIWEFKAKAIKLFSHFSPRPVINTELLAELPRLKHGRMRPNGSGEWVAVMGCVPYRVNLAQLGEDAPGFLGSTSGELFFDIGQVTVNASREELKYSKETKAMLVQRFADLVDEYVMATLASIKSSAGTQWERRLKAQELRSMIALVPTEDHGLLSNALSLKEILKPQVRRGKDGTAATHIIIDESTRIVRQDTPARRSLKGYQFESYTYVVKCTEAELAAFCTTLGIGGVPVELLSTQQWHSSGRARNSERVAQHKQHFFKLRSESLGGSGSHLWEGVERIPLDTDVFVVLERFEALGLHHLGYTVNKDRALAKHFGVPFPEVYGYKNTEKKKVVRANLKGIDYREWREAFLKSLITPDITKQAESLAAAKAFEGQRHWDFSSGFDTRGGYAVAKLDAAHPLAVLINEYRAARARRNDEDTLRELLERVPTHHVATATVARVAAALKRYPLLTSLSLLWGTNIDAWLEYIQLKDAQ